MKAIFPGGQGPSNQASASGETSHETVVARADKLLTQLRSNPASGLRNVRRHGKKYTSKSREYQRNLVVLDYPGHSPGAVQVLHDYDKIYEGTLVFDSSMTEDCIRNQIVRLLKRKESDINDYSEVGWALMTLCSSNVSIGECEYQMVQLHMIKKALRLCIVVETFTLGFQSHATSTK